MCYCVLESDDEAAETARVLKDSLYRYQHCDDVGLLPHEKDYEADRTP